MAGPTRISDILVPEIWVPYLREQTKENSRLYQSGAVVEDSTIDSNIQRGGNAVHIPFWKDLGSDGTIDTVQGDNPASTLTAGKIEADEQVAPVLRRVVSFGAADIAASLAGDDPMRVAADRIAPWWERRFNQVAISVLRGALSSIDLESPVQQTGFFDWYATSGTPKYIDADVVIDARQEALGDAADDLTLMFVHSKVYARLQSLNLIDFIPDARGEVNIPTYLGMQLVVTDTLTVTEISGGNKIYETYICGPGALRYGEAAAKVPVETDRKPEQGDGGGFEYFYSRRDFVIHPLGFKYVGSLPSAGPDNSALATGGNWARVFERKNCPIVGIRTNG